MRAFACRLKDDEKKTKPPVRAEVVRFVACVSHLACQVPGLLVWSLRGLRNLRLARTTKASVQMFQDQADRGVYMCMLVSTHAYIVLYRNVV